EQVQPPGEDQQEHDLLIGHRDPGGHEPGHCAASPSGTAILHSACTKTALRTSILRRSMADDPHPQELAARLEQLSRQQDVFAYGISYGMRAPLRAIETCSALLERGCSDRLEETGREHLQRISDAAARMGVLIESLLDLSRVDRGELSREPVDLGLLFGLAAAELHEA